MSETNRIHILRNTTRKYHFLNTSTKLDPIYFYHRFVPPSEDLFPNSTSLPHFLSRYCSVLLCIYTRLAANLFSVDKVLSELPRYMNYSVFSFSISQAVKSSPFSGRNLFYPTNARYDTYFSFFSSPRGISFANTYIKYARGSKGKRIIKDFSLYVFCYLFLCVAQWQRVRHLMCVPQKKREQINKNY